MAVIPYAGVDRGAVPDFGPIRRTIEYRSPRRVDVAMLWMGLATLFMIFEKLPDIGHRLIKPAGVLLILGGFIVAVQAAGILT